MKFLIILLCSIITTLNLYSQSPKVSISDKEITTYNIKRLTITLDSSSNNYRLPFKELKSIHFDAKTGKKIKEIGYISDVYYIQKKIIYKYFKDSLKTLEIDSAFEEPNKFISIDTTTRIKFFDKGNLSLIKYYPWSKRGNLEWTKSLIYNDEGKKVKEIKVYEPRILNRPNIKISYVTKKIKEFFYDAKGLITQTNNQIYSNDGTTNIYKTEYKYSKGKKTI